jgi:hypothetical protein
VPGCTSEYLTGPKHLRDTGVLTVSIDTASAVIVVCSGIIRFYPRFEIIGDSLIGLAGVYRWGRCEHRRL